MAGFGDMISGLFGDGDAGGRTPGMLMAAGVALLTLVMLRRLWKRTSRAAPKGERPSTRERLTRVSESSRSRETLEHLMVEVQELTRVCAAQMENRALRLERLIREADEKIRRLEGLGGIAPGRDASGVDVGTRPGGADRLVESRLFGRGGASPGAASRPCHLLVQDDVDPVTRRVYGLADQGLTPVEIAGRLEEQVGKVELILALRGH